MAKVTRARKERDPRRVTITARDAQRTLGELLSRVGFGKERITITRHGKEIAALVSAQDLATLDGVV